MGEKCFWSIESNREAYSEPDVPDCFAFVFCSFMEIYSASRDGVTWPDIYCYEQVRGVKFTQYETSLILKCMGWASGKINELRDSSD